MGFVEQPIVDADGTLLLCPVTDPVHSRLAQFICRASEPTRDTVSLHSDLVALSAGVRERAWLFGTSSWTAHQPVVIGWGLGMRSGGLDLSLSSHFCHRTQRRQYPSGL